MDKETFEMILQPLDELNKRGKDRKEIEGSMNGTYGNKCNTSWLEGCPERCQEGASSSTEHRQQLAFCRDFAPCAGTRSRVVICRKVIPAQNTADSSQLCRSSADLQEYAIVNPGLVRRPLLMADGACTGSWQI